MGLAKARAPQLKSLYAGEVAGDGGAFANELGGTGGRRAKPVTTLIERYLPDIDSLTQEDKRARPKHQTHSGVLDGKVAAAAVQGQTKSAHPVDLPETV